MEWEIMAKKYKFILTLPYGIEVDSAEEIEGHVIDSFRSQTDPYALKGVFDSREEAKNAALKCRVYRVKIHYKFPDGGSQYFDSFFGWDGQDGDESGYAFAPDEFEEVLKAYIDGYEYGDMNYGYEGSLYEQDDGGKAWFRFFYVKILKRRIVEFDD